MNLHNHLAWNHAKLEIFAQLLFNEFAQSKILASFAIIVDKIKEGNVYICTLDEFGTPIWAFTFLAKGQIYVADYEEVTVIVTVSTTELVNGQVFLRHGLADLRKAQYRTFLEFGPSFFHAEAILNAAYKAAALVD